MQPYQLIKALKLTDIMTQEHDSILRSGFCCYTQEDKTIKISVNSFFNHLGNPDNNGNFLDDKWNPAIGNIRGGSGRN